MRMIFLSLIFIFNTYSAELSFVRQEERNGYFKDIYTLKSKNLENAEIPIFVYYGKSISGRG